MGESMSPGGVGVKRTGRLREAFPGDDVPRYLIHDRDTIFGDLIVGATRNMGIKSKRIACRSPWQNGICERWIGSWRRELLDHVVPLSEAHLRRLLLEYVRYYQDDRTNLGLGKNTPAGRVRLRHQIADPYRLSPVWTADGIMASHGCKDRGALCVRARPSSQDGSPRCQDGRTGHPCHGAQPGRPPRGRPRNRPGSSGSIPTRVPWDP